MTTSQKIRLTIFTLGVAAVLGREVYLRTLFKYTTLEDRAPAALSLAGIDGHQYELNSYKGKVVVVDVWATWCAQCTRMLHNLETLKNDYADRNVQVLTVNVDEVTHAMNHDQLQAYLTQQQLSFPVLMCDGETAYNWARSKENTGSLPQTYVLDQRGHIRFQDTSASIPKVKAVIDRLLEE